MGALHVATFSGHDEAVKLLIERGADLHVKNGNGETTLDNTKRNNKSSTAAILEAAMKSTKVIYTSSEDLQQQNRFGRVRVTFKDFNHNIIIISNNDIPDGFEFEGHPVFTLRHLQQSIDQLPPPTADNENEILLDNLHDILAQRHPIVAQRLHHWGMNPHHLITYFPKVLSNDTHEAILSLLTKCPQAITSVDIDGMTPLHHAAINLPKKNISQECHDLLLAQSPPTVVHQAIKAGMDWEYLRPIAMAKTDALTLEDEESGLVPFMLAAVEECDDDDDDDDYDEWRRSLSMVYELLCLQPDVLKDYDKSIMANKRTLDGKSHSNNDKHTKRCRLSA